MQLLAVRRRSLVFAAAILTAGVGATAVVGVDAVSAQAPKAKKAPTQSSAEQTTSKSEGDAPATKGTQAIVVLVNDEPVTAWEIEQRASLIASSAGGNPREMKAKAEARWAQIVKDPRTNERFQEYMRQHNARSEEQAKALQAEFVKKLQSDMIEQIRRESRSGMTAQFRKQAQEELIEERLKLQEGKRLGVEVPDDEAKRLLQSIADRNKMTIEQFSQNVKNSGFDVSTLREKLRAEQVWREVVRRKFGAQISINQKDVDRMLTSAASDAGEDAFELQVQRITLPIQARADQSSLVRRYSEAQALHSKADGCKNMAGLAKDATDAKFEDLKYVRPASLPEPTRSLLLLAKDGDVLPPATAANSIEIYAVCGRRAVKGDEKQRENAMADLQQKEFGIVAKRHLFDLRQEAHIEYR
jgi:peptidyl-prolyl cis-trans isomerase SurA